MADIADIVVVGGGVHGASTAWHLAKRNAGKIVLIEKDAIASGASGWSSAIVRMHYQLESLVKVLCTVARCTEIGRTLSE